MCSWGVPIRFIDIYTCYFRLDLFFFTAMIPAIKIIKMIRPAVSKISMIVLIVLPETVQKTITVNTCSP